MQTSGSLEQTSLASLLETMQSERATGTLAVSRGAQQCSLFFLFGHLFHAAGDLGQGEEAVIGALQWRDGGFTFDPRAKLPAEETIKASTADLLGEAERRSAQAPAQAAARTSAAPGAFADMERTVAEPPYTSASTPIPGGAPAGTGAGAPPPPRSPWASPSGDRAPNGEAPSGATVPAAPVPVPSRSAAAPPTAPAPAGAASERAAAAASPVFGAPDAPPIKELYPLPSGKAIYEGLKSAFVDFPKLLRTLEQDKLTGYVRLDGQAFSGVLLLHDGHVLEALYSESRIDQGTPAFQLLRQRMEAGEGLLDVIELAGEIVVALAQLLTARPLFTGLLGRFINFVALIEYLAEEKVDGSLVVTGGSEMGVILFRKGGVLGSYTASNRELAKSTDAVTALATERTARIEVKSGTAPPEGIDVHAALRAEI